MFVPGLAAIGSVVGNEVLKRASEALAGNNVANMRQSGLGASAGNNAANMSPSNFGASAGNNVANMRQSGLGASAGNNAANMSPSNFGASAGNNVANMRQSGFGASAGNDAANMSVGGFNSANQVANSYLGEQANRANAISQQLDDTYQRSMDNIQRVSSLFV